MATVDELIAQAEKKPSMSVDDLIAQAEKSKSEQLRPTVRDIQVNVPEWGRKHPTVYGATGAAYETLKPIVEAGGIALGAITGAAAGTAASAPTAFTGALPLATAGGALGAGLGYAGARQLTSAAGQVLGVEQTKTISQAGKQAFEDVATGATMEAGGQAGTKIVGKGIELVGKGIKQTLGATTGAGPGMVEEGLKGSNAFREAMRGKVTGDEIVDNAAQALNSLKEQRAANYTSQLSKLSKDKAPIDISPIKDKLSKLLNQYGVRKSSVSEMINKGEMHDFSRSVFGKSASKDVKEIADMIETWGSREGDNTPMMLDTLKRRLDDFYSDSSQARQLVTSLRNEVKNAITKQVPQYAEMTKGYAEATNLIKDIESGLMLRKQGMTGRITGDQTLRRLTSAMRENFEMRRDLVNILGEKSGKDLAGQIAGYSASSIIPRGLVGKLAGGGAGYLAYLNPKLWPMLAASSPRAVGEFLNVYGKGLVQAKVISPAVYKTIAFETTKAWEGATEEEKKKIIIDNLKKVNPVSTAEAASALSEASGAKSAIKTRQQALAEAASDEIPQAKPASERVSQAPSTSKAPMSKSEQAAYAAETERLRQELERRKQVEKGGGKNMKSYIPVKMIRVQTAEGEELRYVDNRGKIYESDPNE